MSDQWTAVDDYFRGLFIPPDPALDTALESTVDAGMPTINVAPNEGKMLHLLVRSINARSILEIGTLGGYSTIWLGRALPPGGRLITLEIDPTHAEVARANIERAGLAERVEIRVGPAIEALPQLENEGAGPFDVVFIDADKASTPDYVAWALRLTKPGSMIIIDNVVRNGEVANGASTDADVVGIQRGLAALAEDPRVVTAALQTVGSKGYDGLAFALVTGE
jgi:predicted O-methyltransferase YrrM